MRATTIWLACLALACGEGTRPRGTVDGSMPGGDGSTMGSPDGSGPIDPLCGTAAARWVYVVDSSNAFLRFDPMANQLSPIGTLACSPSASPFSMAIDRQAYAWVLHDDGRIYRVSTADVSCTPTDFQPNQAGFEVFGMGFVSDAVGSTAETLFVAGGAMSDISAGTATLGRIDSASLVLSSVGALPGWPELTGNGRAELWGFFPDTGPPSVRLIDKTSGSTSNAFPMPQLDGTATGDRAWAFAFWGGRFFVFYKGAGDASTNVWRLDPTDGSATEVIHDTGYRIVGAGVSTCAPIDLI